MECFDVLQTSNIMFSNFNVWKHSLHFGKVWQNYHFALMSILNTMHSMSPLSSSILGPLIFLLLCRMGKFHLGHLCLWAWIMEHPSTNFIVILLRTTIIRKQSTRLLHLGFIVVSGRMVEYTTYHHENNLWHLHHF